MLKNFGTGLAILLVAIGLLTGGLFTYGVFPRTITETVEKEVTIEVPVEKIVEVEKLIEVPAPSVLDKALATFLQAVEDEEDEDGTPMNILEDMGYDFDEVSVSKVYDDYKVLYDGDKTTVDFSVKLKFKVEGETSKRETYKVIVIFKEDKDTITTAEILQN